MFLDTEGKAELASQNGLGLSRSRVFIMARLRALFAHAPSGKEERDWFVLATLFCIGRHKTDNIRQMSALDAAAIIFFMLVLVREGSLMLGAHALTICQQGVSLSCAAPDRSSPPPHAQILLVGGFLSLA